MLTPYVVDTTRLIAGVEESKLRPHGPEFSRVRFFSNLLNREKAVPVSTILYVKKLDEPQWMMVLSAPPVAYGMDHTVIDVFVQSTSEGKLQLPLEPLFGFSLGWNQLALKL